jgi:CHASE3 domain sensor protein
MFSTWTIGWRIAVLITLALLALFVVGLVAYRSLDTLIGASRDVTRSHQIKSTLADLISELKDAETGQRGFVITAQDSYLEPYTSGTTEAPKTLAELHEMFAADPEARANLDRIESLVNDKFAELKLTIDTRRSGANSFEATQQIVLSGRGKTSMDEIRTIVAKMDQDQTDLL